MYLSPLLFSTLIIGSIALASAAVIFLVLFVYESKQRNKEVHQHRLEMADMFKDNDLKVYDLTKEVEQAHDWIEMLIQKNNLISQDIKDKLLNDFRVRRPRARMPSEAQNEESA